MALKEYPVYGEGIKGVVLAPARFLDDSRDRLVRLDDGSEFRVPADALEPQKDGSFYLKPRREVVEPEVRPVQESAHAPAAPTQDLPPQPQVVSSPTQVRSIDAGSRTQTVNPNEATSGFDGQLFRHGYTVRRVSVDRILEEPIGPRQEGDTMVYPVIEEVLVVEKRLILREEIYVTPEKSPIESRRIERDSLPGKR